MGKSYKRIAIDSVTEEDLKKWKEKLKKIGLTDDRLLSNNNIIKFINEKANRNPKNITIEEILKILNRK